MSTTVLLTAREQHQAQALTHAVGATLARSPEVPLLVFGEILTGGRRTYRSRCQPRPPAAPRVVRVWPVVVDISPLRSGPFALGGSDE